MKTLFLLFSHSLTEEQKQDARQNLGITNFVKLPEDLQQIFSDVPPELESLDEYLEPILAWLDQYASNWEDYILIQGDFGVTYYLVDYCKSANMAVPVYATTKRQSVDEKQADGSIVTKRIFKHVQFRAY